MSRSQNDIALAIVLIGKGPLGNGLPSVEALARGFPELKFHRGPAPLQASVDGAGTVTIDNNAYSPDGGLPKETFSITSADESGSESGIFGVAARAPCARPMESILHFS